MPPIRSAFPDRPSRRRFRNWKVASVRGCFIAPRAKCHRPRTAQPSGRLRVDVPGRIGRLIIAQALPEFLDRYPQIDIDLGVTDRVVNLIEDSVDCVLRVGPLNDSALIARPTMVILNHRLQQLPSRFELQ